MVDKCGFEFSNAQPQIHSSIGGSKQLSGSDSWSCPRESQAGSEYCIFHAPVEQKDDEDVVSALIKSINSECPEDNELIGAKFGSLELSDIIIGDSTSGVLDLRYAEFEKLWVVGSKISMELLLDGVTVSGYTNFRRTKFEGHISANGLNFQSGVTFGSAHIMGGLSSNNSEFHQKFSLSGVELEGDLMLNSCIFHGDVALWDTVVQGDTNFSGSEIHGYAALSGTTFNGKFTFSDVWAENLYLDRSNFQDYSAFFSLTIENEADFHSADFNSRTVFDHTTFGDSANFTHCLFNSNISMIDVSFKNTESGELDFTDAYLSSGKIVLPVDSNLNMNLTRATLGDLEIACKQERSWVENAIFKNTDFQGFDFSEYRSELEPDWNLFNNPDPNSPTDYRDIEVTYLKAKRGAKSVGDTKAASEFFSKEMKYRRRKYWSTLRSNTSSLLQIKTGSKYIGNMLFDMTCGFGEKPSRVVITSLSVLFLFSAGFWLIQGKESVANAVLISMQSFIAFIPGQGSVSQSIGKIAAATEAFIGTFLIALFVFTLTRSVHR